MKHSPKRILRNQFIVPFGRFRINRPRQSENSPVLVGREGQRAFFVDALTGIGERGAFLITGRRGVGKTTFVENCLYDYRQNSFRRFLGSGVGRTVYDFLLLLVFSLAVIGVLLASGELLTFLVPGVKDSPLLALPLLICVAIAGAPLLAGLRILRTCLSVLVGSFAPILTLLLAVLIVAVILVVPPFGAPTQSVSLLVLGVGILYASGSLFVFKAPLPLGRYSEGTFQRSARWGTFLVLSMNLIFPVCLVSLGIAAAYFGFAFATDFADKTLEQIASAKLEEVHSYGVVGIGFAMILGSILGHNFAVATITKKKTNEVSEELAISRLLVFQTTILVGLGFATYVAVGAAMGIGDWHYVGKAFLAGLFFFLAVYARRVWAYLGWDFLGFLFRQSDQKTDSDADQANKHQPRFFAPPVEAVMALKAFAFILISVQLLYPVLAPVLSIADDVEKVMVHQDISDVDKLPETIRETCRLPDQTACRPPLKWASSIVFRGAEADKAAPQELPTLFTFESREAVGWFIAVFVLLFCLFLVEYEWINRPFVNQRQPRSLDRGPRKPQQVHHHLDPIWFEVSAARQFARIKRENEKKKLRPVEKRELIDLYEPKETRDKAFTDDSLFGRRYMLQRRMLRRFRMMEQTTFAFGVTRLWLPVIEVNVNLGFDSLDHRGVTHAMLDGLRRAYRRTFVRFGTSYQLIRAFGLTFSLTIFVGVLGNAWFDFQDMSLQRNADTFIVASDGGRPTAALGPCDFVAQMTTSSGIMVPRIVCMLPGAVSEPLLKFLYTELVPFPLPERFINAQPSSFVGEPVFWFVHRNSGLPTFGRDGWIENVPSLSVRVYHIVLALLLFALLQRIGRHFPLLPYRRNLSRIEGLLDELTLRRADSRSARSGLSLPSLFGASTERETTMGVETSREAMDPRTVELKFLALLNDLRNKSPSGNHRKPPRLTIPMPDIHFVFDELDKLSGVAAPQFSLHGVAEQDHKAIDSERQRAYKLHRLLSDMKRVISAAPARFIFVGGRSLHDEWVRDQNRLGSTQPLLTSIFDHEIYLPSLLVDLPRARHDNALVPQSAQSRKALDLRVREFLVAQYQSADQLEKELRASRYLPWLGLRKMDGSTNLFTDHVARQRERFANFILIDARFGTNGTDKQRNDGVEALRIIWKQEFFSSLLGFLSYRSAGSPKKLNELISDLVRPSGSFLSPEIGGHAEVPTSRDALVLDEKQIYRVQFINSVFRHIEASFGEDLLQRDDKITINTIFMFDFLMKMHNRAFSWSSIERLDELAHIHRAPDLRRLFDAVILNSAERYFHRVLNGLFAFRFRSELATEIRYLSRISQAEMAALNFTLDESQELKATFTEMLEDAGETNSDLLIALGELYEFDQAYDVARGYYERALRSVDQEFVRLNGETLTTDDPVDREIDAVLSRSAGAMARARVGANERHEILRSDRARREPSPYLHGLASQSEAAKVAVRMNFPWALRRLRLMLQIGLTFEQQADEERAQAQYYSAQLFGSTILRAALSQEGEDEAPLRHVLKHLPLIFQPVFASAWIAEKFEGGVDTSLSILERELFYLRAELPFVHSLDATQTGALPTAVDEGGRVKKRDAESNHALVIAELHNKAGDLYFFKGRSGYHVTNGGFLDTLNVDDPKNRTSGTEGYLLRAHYHYAVALHEVRRFAFYRMNISRHRMNVVRSRDDSTDARTDLWPTLDSRNLPTFVMQTAYSSLVDLAEVTLGRSSLIEAWIELGKETPPDLNAVFDTPFDWTEREQTTPFAKRAFRKLREEIDGWFLWSDTETQTRKDKGPQSILHEYLGAWHAQADMPEDRPLVGFGEVGQNYERILIALMLSMAGGRAVNRSNYPDAASFESQITAEHVIRLLRGVRTILVAERRAGQDVSDPQMQHSLHACRAGLKVQPAHLSFIARLVEIGVLATERIVELRKFSYPKAERKAEDDVEDAYATTDTSMIVAAALAAEMQLLVSAVGSLVDSQALVHSYFRAQLVDHCARHGQALHALSKKMLSEDLIDNVESYQLNFSEDECESGLTKIRRSGRALLIYLVTHHKYPALTNMTALKALIDDALAVDGCLAKPLRGTAMAERSDAASRRCAEAELWIDELLEREKLIDAPMHFPPSNLAETLSLWTMVEEGTTDWSDMARKFRWRAEQSFTMGRQYYQNLSRLIYLFDDFNDRRRHSVHAGQMGMADILALYRAVLDRRKY
ncbi:hypothetical protein [Tropicimonas sp. S265A]|uniref:ATP-binding protein n=1 Tax=Tropicimonas sp. S265A TaxID=3415134 RepID=UPI003C7B98F1